MRAGRSNTISRPPRRSASSIEWVMKIAGRAGLAQQLAELVAQRVAGVLVERAERLVAQQNVRLAREGARDRDALAHAARERVRKIVLVAGQAELAEPGRCDREALVARRPC